MQGSQQMGNPRLERYGVEEREERCLDDERE